MRITLKTNMSDVHGNFYRRGVTVDWADDDAARRLIETGQAKASAAPEPVENVEVAVAKPKAERATKTKKAEERPAE